jgi:hypothetical protein
MDIIKRKILIKKSLKPVDSDNDGVLDSLTLSADDLFVQIPLKQTIKDIGVYTDEQEEEEVINLDSIWDTSNDGSGEIEEEENDEVTTDYTDGEIFGGGGSSDVYGCTNPDALNYNPDATQSCSDCCELPADASGGDAGADQEGNIAAASCHYLSKKTEEKWKNFKKDTGSNGGLTISREWCTGTRSGCPKRTECGGNGCGGEKCCPDPSAGRQKLVESCPDEYSCKGTTTSNKDCCWSIDNEKILKNLHLHKTEETTTYTCKKTETKTYTSNPGSYSYCGVSSTPYDCGDIKVAGIKIGDKWCRKECTDCEEKKEYTHYWYFSCVPEEAF